jgi:hypothetical protein
MVWQSGFQHVVPNLYLKFDFPMSSKLMVTTTDAVL